MRNTVFLLLIGICTLVFGVAGCDGDEKTISGVNTSVTKNALKSSLPVIGLLIYNRNDVYLSTVVAELKKEFAQKVRLEICYAEVDQVTQNEQIMSFIEQKVDALLVNLVDPQQASEIIADVQHADIPTVFFNREPDLDVIKRYPRACFVGTEANEAGVMQGDIIAQLWKQFPQYDLNKDGVFQYIMLQGNSDSAEAILRTQNSVRQAESRGVPMRQLGETYVCNWDRMEAVQAMNLALQRYGTKIELIISNNDSMALGVLDVLMKHGYNTGTSEKQHIPIVGVDAIEEARTAVRSGRMSATVMQDGQGMAKAIAALALNGIAHKDFLAGTPYRWDKTGVAVRIPYALFMP